MRWPWQRRRERMVFEIPFGTLARTTIYDSMIGDPVAISNSMGMPPVSEEVDSMERDASLYRIDRITPLVPVLVFQSRLISEAALNYQIDKASPTELSPELRDAMETAYFAVAYSAAVASISNLVDLKVLRMAGDR